MLLVDLVILPFFCFNALGFSGQITGFVKSESGEPLAGVYVYFDDNSKPVQTNSKDFFTVKDYDGILFFRLPGFQPLTKVAAGSIRNLSVIMVPHRRSQWSVPTCSNARDQDIRIEETGGEITFFAPKNTQLKTSRDIDYHQVYIRYAFHDVENGLHMMFGPSVSSGRPLKQVILGSTELSERSWKCGKLEGVDVRWLKANKKHSRWTGYMFAFAEYYDVSEEAAKFFDSIIDTICCGQGE